MKARATGEHILFANKGTCSIAPEIVLEEVGVPYRLVPVNTRQGKSRTAGYLRINPAGQVPCMIFPDGRIITESAAIVLAFRENCSEHPFASSWCEDRMTDILRWLFFLSGSMTRGYSLSGRPDKFVRSPECQSNLATMALGHLEAHWNIVESSIEDKFFFREGYSVVDVYIVMQLLWDSKRSSLFASRPKLGRLFERVTARPAVTKVVRRHAGSSFWNYDAVNLAELVSQ